MASKTNNGMPEPSAPPMNEVNYYDIPMAIPATELLDLSALKDYLIKINYENLELKRLITLRDIQIINLNTKIEEQAIEISWLKKKDTINTRCLELLNMDGQLEDYRAVVASMLRIKAAYEKYNKYLSAEEIKYKNALQNKLSGYEKELTKQLDVAKKLTDIVLERINLQIKIKCPEKILFEGDLQALNDVIYTNFVGCVGKFTPATNIDALSEQIADIVVSSKTEEIGFFKKYFCWSYANACLQDQQKVQDDIVELIKRYQSEACTVRPQP